MKQIIDRRNGKKIWVDYINFPKHPDGRRNRRHVTAPTKDALIEKIERLRREYEREHSVTDPAMTVAELSQKWQAHVMSHYRSPNSKAAVMNACRHIEAALGTVRLLDLSAHHIDAMYAERKSLSRASLLKIHRYLRKMLDWGILREHLNRNIAALMDPPPGHKTKTQALNHEETVQFLQAAVGESLEMPVLLMACLGMRIGECLGLRWQDIDFDAREIDIVQQARRNNLTNTVELVETLKTETSARVLKMPAEMAVRLLRHRDSQVGAPNPHDLVFPNESGNPLEHSNVRRFMRRISKKAGLTKHVGPNMLRRSTASQTIADGVDPMLVADLMGHADAGTTLRYYRKQLQTAQEGGVAHAATLIQRLDGTGPGSGTQMAHEYVIVANDNLGGMEMYLHPGGNS